MINSMSDTLRAALFSFGADQFAALHECCEQHGYAPVAYVHTSAKRPGRARTGKAAGALLDSIPDDVDFLVPGSAAGLTGALRGYQVDLAVVYGFNWPLPADLLRSLPHGALNVHPSSLPRYRGPAPVHWALRNGDPSIGVTVHRMAEQLDAGPILAQRSGIPLDEEMTQELLWERIEPVVRELLGTALDRVAAGDQGEPQDGSAATHAGYLEPGFSVVDWSDRATDIHNQVRTNRFMRRSPTAQLNGQQVRILRTRTTPGDGVRVECGDGPLWITDYASAE